VPHHPVRRARRQWPPSHHLVQVHHRQVRHRWKTPRRPRRLRKYLGRLVEAARHACGAPLGWVRQQQLRRHPAPSHDHGPRALGAAWRARSEPWTGRRHLGTNLCSKGTQSRAGGDQASVVADASRILQATGRPPQLRIQNIKHACAWARHLLARAKPSNGPGCKVPNRTQARQHAARHDSDGARNSWSARAPRSAWITIMPVGRASGRTGFTQAD
jgi:hypothetical protein